MTRRGWAVAALALAAYGCSWAFGSRPLGVVGVGLAVAALASWLGVRRDSRPFAFRRHVSPARVVEGDDLHVSLELEPCLRIVTSTVLVREQLGDRRYEVQLAREEGRFRGGYAVRTVPRGRYAPTGATAVVGDAFGLAAHALPLPRGAPVVVLPRLVELETLFSDAGSAWWDGRRLLLRRPAGFDLHGVRDYERGDSLRAVHWRSTAKRGELMVKELEDSPRADVAVVLDCHAMPALGSRPETPFDAAVRAAGSLLAVHVRRGRTASLLVNADVVERLTVAAGKSWDEALEHLARADADGRRDVAACVEQAATAQVPDVTVVTSSLSRRLVTALVARAMARRRVALVLVDAASFGARARDRDPGLARLAAAGVPLAVVRRGDDLRAKLEAPALAQVGNA